MSTTIDSLEIQIQSNSTNAAAGINALATSLGNLKKNGTVGVAVKNLNNLSASLKAFTTLQSPANKIGALSSALKGLKSVGSVGTVANSLTKLSAAMTALGNVNIAGVEPKIRAIATAMAPLSAVKAGGLNTMLNGLMKLSKVTASLDDATIQKFTQRVQLLTDALTPLAQKLTTIQAGLSGVNAKSRQTTSGVQHLGDRVNVTTMNLSHLVTTLYGVIAVLQPVIRLLTSSISTAIEWDGISARFGRGFGVAAQDTYDWIQRLNAEMGINVQQFMQYSSVYATMLTGFGVAVEDASEMALGYTELTYDIWAGYNDIYKNFADAAEAVKSAIAGEVEPIRRAGFTIVEATLKQTAANHGLEVSLETATEAQKSYLRYLTLVDQAHAQGLIGTYAKELNTAEGLMRTLSQQAKSLAQALGSLFLPMLAAVIPYVQAFVEMLTEAIITLAALFGITIQGVSWGDYNSGVGAAVEGTDSLTESMGSAAGAAKELKNATLGIDELNVISPPSGGGGGGGSGNAGGGFEGLDVESLWDESIFADINNQVDAIKEKLEGWMPVIGAIAGMLAGLGILTLLQHLGDSLAAMAKMDGMLATLKRTLAGLAILTIEAVLVFMLTDEYLESGNLMSLIGEALVTAAGGYLMYRGFGPKGLIVSLGVSLLTQLVAITMNLADGGVDFTDPELWIQSAFTTALGGVAGGILAYKGLIKVPTGKAVGLGLLASLSLTLAAITIGEVLSNGEITTESIFTAVGSVLSGAGFGFMVGGPTGAMIGAAVSLSVNIVGFVIGSIAAGSKRDLEKELNDHMGDVELSVSEVKLLIEKLTPEWADELAMAVELRRDVSAKLEDIETQIGLMGAYEWQVSVGMKLTEDDMAVYMGSITRFIDSVQNYVDQRGYALEVGLKATTTNQAIIDSANNISVAASEELSRLGKELQDTINAAYEDGLLDIDELKTIQTIRNDMQEVVNALAQSDIEAEFSMLEMKWSGVDLTPESYSAMMAEWTKVIQEEVKPALENTVKENLKTLEGNVQFAKMQLEKNPGDAEARQMLRDAETALQAYIDENPLESLTAEATLKQVTFGVNTVRDAYAKELKKLKDSGVFDYTIALDEAVSVRTELVSDTGDVYQGVNHLVYEIRQRLELAQYELSGDARAAIIAMVDGMQPAVDDLQKIADASRKAGKAVPQNVREGINDYNELLALTGEIDNLNYTIGKSFSTDPVFLNTLAVAEDAGRALDKSVQEGLLNNIEYVYDAASGLIIGIRDTVNNTTIQMTPTMEKNLADMGVNMGDALGGKYQYVYDETTGLLTSIVDSVSGNAVWVNEELRSAGSSSGSELSEGLKTGVEATEPGLLTRIGGWADRVLEKMRTAFGINSPSKKTQEMGRYLGEGLSKGLSIDALKDKLISVWNKAKDWWNKSKGALKTYTPSIGSIYEKVKERWDNARTWYNTKKSGLKTYTPSFGSIYEKLKERWDNARTWYNTKKAGLKTYTPSIGNIKSKLESAWSSAKSWWNKNVKLSIPSLKFKVTYSKPDGAVSKAVIKALGLSGWPKLSFAAAGGMFDMGSLIWAGERGAEIVANAGGGKTGVMNVQQMQEAVYEGVYAAIMAAQRSGNGGDSTPAVKVYLDGRQITASVEQRQHERGASIMGKQVLAY